MRKHWEVEGHWECEVVMNNCEVTYCQSLSLLWAFVRCIFGHKDR